MANDRYVIDTSAIFTLIEDEEGASRVEQILKKEEILIPWVALMEMIYISQQERGEELALNRYAMLKQTNAEILWNADEPTLLTAAKIKASHRLSFADSVIAAVAVQHDAILLHKDPEYEPLSVVIEMESLPYKK
ncbi:MAG: PIN domain-containing protein [Anaerolineales bacterium]|nr:PIN domain-containing protein [Anaerolineales bacterium]